MSHVTSVQNPGWLFYIRDSTTQVYWDYDKPLFEDPVMNQYLGGGFKYFLIFTPIWGFPI